MTDQAPLFEITSGRRRRRALFVAGGAAMIAAVAAGIAWWWLQPAREGVRLHAGASAFPWSRAPSSGDAADAAAAAPAAAVPAAAGSSSASAALSTAPSAFDLCGLGRVVVPSGGSDREGGPLAALPAPVGRFPLAEAQARVGQVLAAGDAKQRVASRVLQPADEDSATVGAWARGLLADGLASGDAQAQRWAAAACPFLEDEARCRRQLARARVQAEPANALHWLHWASEEPEAADAAWAGLLRARYWREQPLGLAGLAVRALPADVPAYLQSTLAVDAMARDAAFPAPPLSIALERCRPAGGGAPAATSPGVPGASPGDCERLARLLVEKGDSVQALMLGRELGEHIGWTASRLQQLDQEVDHLQRQEHRWAVDERRPLGCETVEGQRSHITAVEREGELPVLRRGAAAPPPPGSAAPSAGPR